MPSMDGGKGSSSGVDREHSILTRSGPCGPAPIELFLFEKRKGMRIFPNRQEVKATESAKS